MLARVARAWALTRSGAVVAPACTTLDRLRAVTRDVQLRLAETLVSSGDHGLRPSFGPLLERVRDDALPIGRVAADLGVSPQAASRAALTLEDLGYVTRTASATDGRSRLVTLTDRGRALIDRARDTFVECERAYASLVGRAAVERMLRDVDDLRQGLGLTPESGPMVHARAARSVGSFILVTLHAKQWIVTASVARGHGSLRPSHLELFLAVGSGGGRVSEAARALRVSRQAVSAMVQDLERLGYLERRADVMDGRAVRLLPTDLGRALLGDVAAETRRLEARYRMVLGEERWARFVRDLVVLDDAVAAAALGGEHRQAAPAGTTSTAELERLAGVLRSRLGSGDAARLGALLCGGPTRGRA